MMGKSMPNSGWSGPTGQVRRARPLSAGSLERKDPQKRTGAVLHAANIQQAGTSVVSGHPDAVRRREQAAARRAAAQIEAEQAQRSDWWQVETPANITCVSSPEGFRSQVSSNDLVVAEFFAPWCAACRRMFPKLIQIAGNNRDIKFLAVNGGHPSLSKYVESLGIDRLPYFQFYQGGELKAQFAANLTKVGNVRAEVAHLRECKEPHHRL